MSGPNRAVHRPPVRHVTRRTPVPFLVLLAAGTLLAGLWTGRTTAAPVAPPAGAAAPAGRPAVTATPLYYGVYLRGGKVGSCVVTRTPVSDQDRAPGMRLETVLALDLRVLGAPARITNTTVAWTTPDGKPQRLEYRTVSADRTTKVTATYGERSVRYQADITGTRTSGVLELKPGESFIADAGSGGGEIKPRIGLRLAGKVFSPETLTLIDAETTVVGREPVAVGGQSVSAFKVVSKNPFAPATLWLTDEGELLRMDGALGIELRREPKETALAAPDKAATLDLATAIAIRPTGVALENPRALRRAEYEIRGLSKPLPVRSGSVQTVTHEPDGGGGATGAEPRLLARITVTTGPLPAGETARRFRAGQTVPDDLKPFLKATPYVPAADARFVALAGSVVGGETDLARAAAKIAAWTHRTVTPDPGIAALRTASDILQTPRGVCRDYTTLFTAVARAAGIPTKQCVGLAFADGRFLYHAWPEVWVGDNRWVALEPTWGAPFADATHIKLAEGEITDFFGAAADAGSLQIRVVRAATDSAR